MNKTARKALVFPAAILLAIGVALGCLLLPPVQSFIGQRAARILSEHIPQQISVGQIDIGPTGRVTLSDISIADHHGDTLARIDSVKARLGLWGLLSSRLSLSKAEIYAPRLKMIRYAGENKNSLALFIDNFKKTDKKQRKPFYVDIANAQVYDGDFSYRDDNTGKTYGASGADFSVSDISIAPGDYHGSLDELNLSASFGVDIRRLSGHFRLCPQGVIADDVRLLTDRSDLRFSASAYFRRDTPAGTKLVEKLKSSQTTLYIAPSRIVPCEIASLYPPAASVPAIELTTRVTTQPDRIDLQKLKITIGNVLSTDMSGRINTPGGSIRQGNGKIVLKYIEVIPTDAVGVMNGLTGEYIPENTYDKISSIEKLSGNGLITLKDENVTAIAALTTQQHGKIFLRAESEDLWNKRKARYTAKAVLENVNAGLATGSKDLGRVTLFSDIKGQGFDLRNASATFHTSVHLLEYKNYPYTGIDISSRLEQGVLTSEMSVADPNLQAKLSATVFATDRKGVYNGTLNMYLDDSDLHALHIVQDSISNLRGTIQADITGSNIDDVTGTLSFSEVSYNYHYIDRILIESQAVDSVSHRLSVVSDGLFDGYIEGNYRLSEVPAAVMNGLLSGFKPYRKRPVTPGQKYSFRMDVTASEVKVINTPLIFGGSTQLHGAVNTSGADFSFNLTADRINYRDVLIDTLNFHLNTATANVLNVKAQKLLNPVYSIENLDLSAVRYADSLSIRSDFYKWNSADSVAYHLHAYQKDDEQGNIVVGVLPSEINLERIKWTFGGYSPHRDRITWNVEKGAVQVDSLEITSGEAVIRANGFYASQDLMDMRLSVQSLDLSRVVFLRNGIPLRGRLNGSAHLAKTEDDKALIPEISLSIDSLGVRHDEIGDLNLAVKADLAERYINTSASLVNGRRKALDLSGGLHIQDRSLVSDMRLTLDSLPVDVVHYLLPNVFNKSAGYASAGLTIEGPVSALDINGAVRLDRTRLGINFTNVEYVIPDSTVVPVRNSFFYFDKIKVRDAIYASEATLDGRIYHDNFKPWYLDLRTDVNKTLVLNTSDQNNEKFYGKVFASGYMTLKGETNQLKYNIDARTERGTGFAIDIGTTSDFKVSEMITFIPPRTSHEDSLLLDLNKKLIKSAAESSSEMDITVEATPSATLSVYLDKAEGHMIEANGSGKMRMHLSRTGNFTLDGTYEVAGGNYTFVYRNLIKRPFNLLSGGKITFDGDPSDPLIDISATYKITTKPAVFLSSAAENSREDVLMTINLTGNLSDPVYNFDIQMPRATESVREELAYRLSDQEQLNQQFISLMAINSFTAGSENNDQNLVASGVAGLTAGMLSSQFSGILQRFVQGVDINVNLNTSTNKVMGTTESTDVEFGISTKLFDDRVTVNGMVGVPTGTTQSDLVGDVEIEYNISADGRFRGVFINQRQNDYMNQQGYIQSLGVSYRQEFNTFRELGSLIKQTFQSKNPEKRKARQARKVEKATRKAEKRGETVIPNGETPDIPMADTTASPSFPDTSTPDSTLTTSPAITFKG